MFERLKGVMALDAGTFEDIEHDPSAITQAIIVVVVASILSAIGGSFGQVVFGAGIADDGNTMFRFLSIALWAVIAWLVWSVVTWVIGTKVFNGDASPSEMMRVIGFAYAPLAFGILAPLPLVGWLVPWLVAIWSVIAVFIAVGTALDLQDGVKTAVTVLVGWLIYLIGMGVFLYYL
jgi:hypothetical protein